MPRYSVTEQSHHNVLAYLLEDADRHAEALFYPSFGFNCIHFRTTPDPDGKDAWGQDLAPVDIFVPPSTPEELRTVPFHGGQPILFPFPNRVRGGTYTFDGRTSHMEKSLSHGWDRGAGQAIHGLVGDKPWIVNSASAHEDGAIIQASLQLDSFPDIREQYPYPCQIEVLYRLHNGILEMHTTVRNTGTETLPMGFGIHPWFSTVLRPGIRNSSTLSDITPEQRAQAQVMVPAEAIWELDHLMPTGRILSVETDLDHLDLRAFRPLDSRVYDHVFTRIDRSANGWSEAGLRDPSAGLELYIAADNQFREWVFYAPSNRPVIALEPYTCTTDAVNLQPRGLDAGLIALPSGQEWAGDIRFGLRRILPNS